MASVSLLRKWKKQILERVPEGVPQERPQYLHLAIWSLLWVSLKGK